MFLVDSNVLIEAKNRYYAFDIAPGFWAWLDHAHANYYLVAYAKAYGHVVVTHELPGPTRKHVS